MTVLTVLISMAAIATGASPEGSQLQQRSVENRHIFNPRMDYDEWKPLGRGDPLKNDPTYDYVPPVLDRVHYWMDPSKRTPDPPLPNAGVMVMSSQTETPTTAVPATSRLGTMSLFDPFLKFMETSKATLGFSTPSSSFYRPTTIPTQYIQPTHNHPFFGTQALLEPPRGQALLEPPRGQALLEPPRGQALQRPPYTMLMPPPPPSSTEPPVTSFGTTIRTTTEADEEVTTIATTEATMGTSSTTASTHTTNLANSENLYKPVAINMPESICNETIEVMPTISLPKPEEDSLPIMSLFSDNSNHLQYQEVKLPSVDMIPPSEEADEFFDFRPTTVRTTTSRTLTTDPMFKHYKQPKEPLHGPFYLIIQGHSKVKTYGASKNKVKAFSSNEINYEDGKIREDEDDLVSKGSNRRERKLFKSDVNEEDAEIVEGHPTVELSASFKTRGQTMFRVSNDDPDLIILEDAFPKSKGGGSKKRFLVNEFVNETSRRRRSTGRSLLAVQTTKEDTKGKPTLDKDLLSIESLIALNDDYDTGDIISLLNNQEGEGSGVSGFVSSLLSRSQQSNEEM